MITTIVCTYNRCESLRDTLRALKDQRFNGGSPAVFEIVVVDNNSSDQTPDVVRESAKDAPWPIRYVFEKNQGQSWARNRGIREAKGDFLIFTDDDVLPAPDWADALWKACNEYEADVVGGPVVPLWIKPPPIWLLAEHRQFGILALMDRGDKPVFADPSSSNFIIGANMAFRREVFDEVGPFRTDLGAVGTKLFRGEDSELLKRMLRASKRVLYTPDAVVKHKVQPERMRVSYLRKWNYNSGKSFARMSTKQTKGVPRWLVRECIESAARALWNYACGAKANAIDAEAIFWNKLGMIRELGRNS